MTGAVFIVCLVITSRFAFFLLPFDLIYSAFLSSHMNLLVASQFLLKYMFFLFSLLIKCSLWSSAIILLVLAMIIVDLMV